MIKAMKTVLGVTLLEIMLVLAVAAMVIVMSIRYYQSAQTSQAANAAMNQIQAIASAMDNIALGTGAYNGGDFSSATLSALIGTLISPTGGTLTVTPASASTYTVSMALGVAVCTSVKIKLAVIPKVTTPACDPSTGTLTYTYNSTK